MLTWPHPATDWRPWLHEVEPVYVEITRHTGVHEVVIIVCHDAAHKTHVAELLSQQGIPSGHSRLYIAPSNDSWARDHGPLTVLADGQPRLLDFTFNGWGNKYAAELDNRITATLHAAGAFGTTPCRKIDFVLEGGSIETDGRGTLLTTASCLLSGQRNTGMSRQEIEEKISEYLGATRIIWLAHGQLLGDDTDGHIDTLVRFVNEHTLMYATTDNPDNPNYTALTLMEKELRSLTRTNGEPYHLVPLPSPAITNKDGAWLPASYANFLIINDTVLLPVYGVDTDETAIHRFREYFADREIIAINCRPLLEQFGSLHCISMHLPAGVIL